MKVIPISFNFAGSLGFSLACPQPGQTASTCSLECVKHGRVSTQQAQMGWNTVQRVFAKPFQTYFQTFNSSTNSVVTLRVLTVVVKASA